MEGSLRRHVPTFTASLLALAAAACTGDLGINEYSFACENDSDCPAGLRCDLAAGCVRAGTDGGPGIDRGPGTGDRGEDRDASDPSDQSDPSDAGDGGRDGGRDSGASRDAGLSLRFSSVQDTAAGISRSGGYRLKSVTGWTAGFRWGAGGYTLQSGQPFGNGRQAVGGGGRDDGRSP